MCLDKPNPKTFIEYSNTLDDVYNNVNDYNSKRKRKMFTFFDVMIADINTNKKNQAIIKELVFRCKKLNKSVVFITQFYFSAPKEVRLNATHYLIMKIHNKRVLQHIAFNHSAGIDYKDFMNIYKNCKSKPYSLLNIDTILTAHNLLLFRKHLLDSL